MKFLYSVLAAFKSSKKNQLVFGLLTLLLLNLTTISFAEPIVAEKTSTPNMTKFTVQNYSGVSPFKDGVAIVSSGAWNPKMGLINKEGMEVVSPQYDGVKYLPDYTMMTEGMVVVKKGMKWGFLSKEGKETAKPQFDDADLFSDGLAAVKVNEKWGYADKSGNIVIRPQYDLAGYFGEGFAPVKINEKWGFIDKQGMMVIPPQYEWKKKDLRPSGFINNVAIVVKNGLYGLIDKTGKAIVPAQYQNVDAFSEGYLGVKKNGLWGFVDSQGKEVIPPQYDEIKAFSDGMAAVYKTNFMPFGGGNQWGYIDTTGKIVIPLGYVDANKFSEGLAFVVEKKEELIWGTRKRAFFINKAGEKILRVKLAESEQELQHAINSSLSFNEGLAPIMVIFMTSFKNVFIDKQGNVILSTKK